MLLIKRIAISIASVIMLQSVAVAREPKVVPATISSYTFFPADIMSGSGAEILPIVNQGGACDMASKRNTGLSANRKTIMTCVGGAWTPMDGYYWGAPVASYAVLSGINTDPVGSVRVTTDTGRMFIWRGGTWQAISVDQNGNLIISGVVSAASGIQSGGKTIADAYGFLIASNQVTAGDGCGSNGAIAKDATGALLTCQAGLWRNPMKNRIETFQSFVAAATPMHVNCPTAGSVPVSCQQISSPSGNYSCISNMDDTGCWVGGCGPVPGDGWYLTMTCLKN